MTMTYEHLLATSCFVAAFILLALLWVWLVLALAHAIKRLWRELAGSRSSDKPAIVARRPPSAVGRPATRVPLPARGPRTNRPARRPGLLSRLVGWLLRPPEKPKRIAGKPPFNRWSARPRWAERAPPRDVKPAADAHRPAGCEEVVENAAEAVPLFVVDAPLFQSDPDVLEARPADIMEVLEDACATARAAGRTDEEITRMLAEDARWAHQREAKTK